MADIFETARIGAKLLMQLESFNDTPFVLRFDMEQCMWRCEVGDPWHSYAQAPTPHEAVENIWQIMIRYRMKDATRD